LPRGYPDDGLPRKKPHACQVCRHPERVRIEALHCAGVSLDKISARFDVSRDAIWRHVQKHMSDAQRATYLVGPGRIAELQLPAAEENGSILDYLAILRSTLVAQLDRFAKANDAGGVAQISGPLLQTLKALGRVTGEINTLASNTIVNVTNNAVILNSAPVADIQAGLLEVCARHPDARADIVELFRRLDEKYAQKALAAPPMREVSEVASVAA
jgi:hypothetical protein